MIAVDETHAARVHPVAALFPMLDAPALQALADDIEAHGLIEPIVVHDGVILDGRNRLAACELIDLEPDFRDWEGSEEEIGDWILSKNLHRRHLDAGQRAMVASRLKETWSRLTPESRPPGKLRELAAAALNVSSGSVTYADQVRASGDEELVEKVERGEVPVSVAAAQVRTGWERGLDALDAANAAPVRVDAPVAWGGYALFDDAETRADRERLLRLALAVGPERFFELVNPIIVEQGEPGSYGISEALHSLGRLADGIDEVAGGVQPHVDDDVPISQTEGYDGDSWGTPQEILDDARSLLGTIDLDPATHAAAQARIQATTFYTKEDDGLSREWHGRVWLNPPYSHPLVAQFAAKMIAEYTAGRVTEGLILVNNATSAKWFQSLLGQFPACFPEGRIAFLTGDGKSMAGARQGQAIFYLGPHVASFKRVFGGYGVIVVPA